MRVLSALSEAAEAKVDVLCFPECYVPGYRVGVRMDAPNQQWLEKAWGQIDAAAAEVGTWVILGTERIEGEKPRITTRITRADGSLAGFQDKVQLDPSEESTYGCGTERHLFGDDNFRFGVVICHEGWRYPETVRWAARAGAHIVFHPHFELVENLSYRPKEFADPSNTFHEKAALCRAAENTCYFGYSQLCSEGRSDHISHHRSARFLDRASALRPRRVADRGY